MNKISLSKREILIFIACVILVGIFVAWQFIVKPMQDNGGDVDSQLTVTAHKLREARGIISQKQAIDNRRQELINLVGTARSESAEMSALVSLLESAARDANIHIANIQPMRSRNGKGVIFFPVEVQVDGQWVGVVQFMHAVQSKPNYFFIDEMNLEKYSDASGSLRGRIVVSRMRLAN